MHHIVSAPPERWNTRSKSLRSKADFLGFGAAPPARNPPTKKKSQGALLKDAEILVQVLLGNTEKLSKASIEKAIQMHTTQQTKKRYKTLLEKPWRTGKGTPDKQCKEPCDREEVSESNAYETSSDINAKSQQGFYGRHILGAGSFEEVETPKLTNGKRKNNASWSGSMGWGDDPADETSIASNLQEKVETELHEANIIIKALREEMSVLRSSEAFANSTGSSMSIDHSDLFHCSFQDVSGDVGTKTRKHRPEKVKSRVLEEKIAKLEKDLARANKRNAETGDNVTSSSINRVELHAMKSRIAALEDELAYSEARSKEMDEKVQLFGDSSNRDASRCSELEMLLRSTEKQLDSNKIELAVANASLQSNDRKLKRDEGQNSRIVSDLKMRLLKSEEKSKLLHEELSSLMPLTTEIAQIKIDLQTSEAKLERMKEKEDLAYVRAAEIQKRNDEKVQELQERLIDAKERSVEAACRFEQANKSLTDRLVILNRDLENEKHASREKHLRLETQNMHLKDNMLLLEEDLIIAEQKKIDALKRVDEVNEAADGQMKALDDAMSEELRESENQIACCVDELNILRPLVSKLDIAESKLAETTAKLVRTEEEISGMTKNDDVEAMNAALEMSKIQVGELRDELDLFKPLAGDLKRTEYELEETKSKLRRVEEEMASLKENLDSQTSRSTQSSMEKEVREAKEELLSLSQERSDARKELKSLRDRLCTSESTADELQKELNFMKPLLNEYEQAVNELDTVRAELEEKERQCVALEGAQEKRGAVQRTNSMTSQRVLKQLRAELAEATEERDDAEHRVLDLLSDLEAAKADMNDMASKLDLLKPLATDLENAEVELENVRNQLKNFEQKEASSNLDQSLLSTVTTENTDLRNELDAVYKECALVEQRASSVDAKLRASKDLVDTLQKELNLLRPQHEASQLKIEALQKEFAESEHQREDFQRLEQALQQKEKLVGSLKEEIESQEKQINSARLKISEMEEQRFYLDAKMAELAALADTRNTKDSELQLREKTNECAKLTGERNTLRQKLNVVEAMAATLENENTQKKELLKRLMEQGDASTSQRAFMETLQAEQDRTLKRCGTLSLQLAESQFEIDTLTQKLRQATRSSKSQALATRRSSEMDQSIASSSSLPVRSESRRSLKTFFGTGIGRRRSDDDVSYSTDWQRNSINEASNRGTQTRHMN